MTDALGREQVIVQPYCSGSSLLRSGLNKYLLELGGARQDYVLGAATFRRGLSDT